MIGERIRGRRGCLDLVGLGHLGPFGFGKPGSGRRHHCCRTAVPAAVVPEAVRSSPSDLVGCCCRRLQIGKTVGRVGSHLAEVDRRNLVYEVEQSLGLVIDSLAAGHIPAAADTAGLDHSFAEEGILGVVGHPAVGIAIRSLDHPGHRTDRKDRTLSMK